MGIEHKLQVLQKQTTTHGWDFLVTYTDAEEWTYKVQVSYPYYESLTEGKITPKELVRRSFVFLLEREGPDQILGSFDLKKIQSYFGEYPEWIQLSLNRHG